METEYLTIRKLKDIIEKIPEDQFDLPVIVYSNDCFKDQRKFLKIGDFFETTKGINV